jgi:hypothetical protein
MTFRRWTFSTSYGAEDNFVVYHIKVSLDVSALYNSKINRFVSENYIFFSKMDGVTLNNHFEQPEGFRVSVCANYSFH